MICHRALLRLILVISAMIVLITLPLCAQHPPEGWSTETHGANADPNYDLVFPDDHVVEIALVLDSDQWIATDADEHHERTTQCAVHFEGRTWTNVQMRITEEALAAWQQAIAAPDLLLRFDPFDSTGQRFYGFSEIELRGSNGDPSRVRTKVVFDLLRDAGVPALRASFCSVRLQTEGEMAFVSIYTMVEVPGAPMLDTQFDEDDGSLFLGEGEGVRFDDLDPHAFVPLLLANEEHDVPSPEALLHALHAEGWGLLSWRINLESVFDVYGYLRWLAFRTVLGSFEGYGRTLDPIAIYWDPGDRRFHWIPIGNLEIAPEESNESDLLDLSLDDVGDEWPLIRLLADDPAYKGTYDGYVNELLKGVFQVGAVHDQLRQAHGLIEPYVLGAEVSPEERRFLPPPGAFFASFDELLFSIEDRYAQGSEYLDSIGFSESPIVISEIHYNPSLEQGIDNNFEFVELFNRGNRTVDLSGYMFIEGLLIELPPRTVLSPGQCLMLTKRAATYKDAPCEVQQWVRGSLSNGGETLRLIDREGVEVDSVSYDDVDPWPTSADAGGLSLEIVDPGAPNFTYVNWRASGVIGGSPGWVER